MNKLFKAALTGILILVPLPLLAAVGDENIVAAREAVQKGDRNVLEKLAASNDAHVLMPYVRYWLLVNKLARPEPVPTKELEQFLDANSGTLLAERIRAVWMTRLMKDQDWKGLLNVFGMLQAPNQEQICQSWTARINTGDRLTLADASSRWKKLVNAPAACNDVLKAIVKARLVNDDAVWWRFREQMQLRNPAVAKETLGWFASNADPGPQAFKQIVSAPATYLDRLPANFASSRKGRELAIAALIRLMRTDLDGARRRFTRVQDRLKAEERAYVWSHLAYQAALSHAPQALDWYKAAGNATLSPNQRAWRIRAALRANEWRLVQTFIEALPPAERESPQWTYWLARAYAARGNADEAMSLYLRLADIPDYYGLLANEEMGLPFELPTNTTPILSEYQSQVKTDAGLARALALFRLGMRVEGEREWNWALRNKSDDFLLAAAQLALENNIYDRAINTAERIREQGHYDLRFLMPYRALLEPHVTSQNLELGWVYGVIRQESRFIVPARSTAGAQGLMQVMPATGKWVAKKVGMADYKPNKLSDPETNVYLGTQYMRMVLDELDNHPVLASAGYNAGPGRARRWRSTTPLEGAIYVETIPIHETQDYVKKVMTNTVIYAAMLEGKPQSLKSRLGFVTPPPAAPAKSD